MLGNLSQFDQNPIDFSRQRVSSHEYSSSDGEEEEEGEEESIEEHLKRI